MPVSVRPIGFIVRAITVFKCLITYCVIFAMTWAGERLPGALLFNRIL